MRRALVLGLVVLMGTAALAAPAEAGKKKKAKPRKAEATYVAGPGFCCEPVGGATFPTQPTETFVDVVVEDVTGLPAPSFVGQDPDGDNMVDGEFFCGKIDNFPIMGGVEVFVFVIASPVCLNDFSPGLATTGTITSIFSSAP